MYDAGEFDKKSYIENDQHAKDLFTTFLVNKGHNIIKDEEDYNHDLVTELNGEKFYFELEMKRNYPFTNRKSFTFPTVSFLGRKKRLHEKNPFLYVIICRETNCALYCESNIIFQDKFSEKITIYTKRRSGNDLMYRVPKKYCKFFKIQAT